MIAKPKVNQVIILENDHPDTANLHKEQNLIAECYPDIPVKKWFDFYNNSQQDKTNWERQMRSINGRTLLLTYTTFTGGAGSGYGDVLGMWLNVIDRVALPDQRLTFCIGTFPGLGWQLIYWVQQGKTKKARLSRERLVRRLIRKNAIYCLNWSEYDIHQATLLTLKWWKLNYFAKDVIFHDAFGNRYYIEELMVPIDSTDPIKYYFRTSVPEQHQPAWAQGSAIELERLQEITGRVKKEVSCD